MRQAKLGAKRRNTRNGLLGGSATLTVLLQAKAVFGQAAEAPKPAPAPPAAEPAPPAAAERPADGTPAPAAPPSETPVVPSEAPPTSGSTTSGATTSGAAGTSSTTPSGTSPSPVTTSPSGATSPGLGFGEYPGPAAEPEKTPESASDEEAAAGKPEHDPNRVFAEDWWSHTRPTVEFHGNFRVRTQLYHHFALGRIDSPTSALWPRPEDDNYTDLSDTEYGAAVCTEAEAGEGDENDPGAARYGCGNPTQAGANLRLRVEPTIIISDNLRIRSQIDLLDNLILGSTAQGYSNYPTSGGYGVSTRDGYTPYSGATVTQGAPVSGINSLQDSITVKRAWAEYETPFGQARFGRMPDHFGLGLLHNAGDDIDGDFQSTVDRLSFVTGLPSLSLYAAGAWDFPYEGATSQGRTPPGVPGYDVAQYDDVSAMNLILFRKIDPQLEKLMLAKGQIVVNGGLYLTYSFQRIANDYSGSSATCSNGANALGCSAGDQASGYVRRGMEIWTPDLYAEVKYKRFRFATEVVTHQGTLQTTSVDPGDNDYENPNGDVDGWRVNQWGVATEISQLLVEDRLKLGFFFGWGSGDGDVEGLTPGQDGFQQQLGNRSIDTFRFHPGYRVDLILNRHILSRVQGSYYFKPMAQYDFIRDANGMRLGGRAEAIWTRASNFMQAPGHQADLGIELNGSVYFQSKDGALNDDPDLVGGLYTMIQYGVLFPMSGLGYQSQQRPTNGTDLPGLETAQTVRLFLGVAY